MKTSSVLITGDLKQVPPVPEGWSDWEGDSYGVETTHHVRGYEVSGVPNRDGGWTYRVNYSHDGWEVTGHYHPNASDAFREAASLPGVRPQSEKF